MKKHPFYILPLLFIFPFYAFSQVDSATLTYQDLFYKLTTKDDVYSAKNKINSLGFFEKIKDTTTKGFDNSLWFAKDYNNYYKDKKNDFNITSLEYECLKPAMGIPRDATSISVSLRFVDNTLYQISIVEIYVANKYTIAKGNYSVFKQLANSYSGFKSFSEDNKVMQSQNDQIGISTIYYGDTPKSELKNNEASVTLTLRKDYSVQSNSWIDVYKLEKSWICTDGTVLDSGKCCYSKNL